MVLIKELEIADKKCVRSIAELHKRAFPNFFLTQLGVPFLKTLYAGYLEDKDSGIIVAEENGDFVGFIAYSYDYPRFYKLLIKHHILTFAACSIGAAIIHPKYIKRLFGAFQKSESVVKDESYVELASICVDPQIEGRGIGSALIDYLKSLVNFNTYSFINLETDADGNDETNQFYVKNGFSLKRTYTTAEGRKMNEYRYSPGA